MSASGRSVSVCLPHGPPDRIEAVLQGELYLTHRHCATESLDVGSPIEDNPEKHMGGKRGVRIHGKHAASDRRAGL